jgi:hypothetical protein
MLFTWSIAGTFEDFQTDLGAADTNNQPAIANQWVQGKVNSEYLTGTAEGTISASVNSFNTSGSTVGPVSATGSAKGSTCRSHWRTFGRP